jgi:hypothetical protein
MKPDVLLTWPTRCDYPLWRKFIKEERERFSRVIVVFSNHGGPSYRDFVATDLALHNVIALDSPEWYGRDWRDVAVNAALHLSDNPWVWFTEQDFSITDNSFWWTVSAWEECGFEIIGLEQDTLPEQPRLHPCCLFVKRELVDATSRYFGPDEGDHFWKFSQELYAVTRYPRMEISKLDAWHHMNGLSHNHQLVDEGKPVLYHPYEFREYLLTCLRSGEALHPEWKRQVEAYV